MSEETNQTEELLKCSKCKEWKPCSAFSKKRNTKRGYQYKCKECGKQYRKDNKQHYKQYYQNNIKYIKRQQKQYLKDNIKNRKQYRNTPFKIDNTSKHLKEIKIYEPYIIDSDNDVNFQCAYCGVYFKTTKQQIWHRLNSINGEANGTERRLYCSQQCKDECPVYNQRTLTKDQKAGTSREVQPELRKMVLARDNYTCQKCNKHKDELEVSIHCHHIWPTNEDPITSADMDTCITYCKDCHKWVHMNVPGCGYAELRCSLEDEMLV